MKPYYDHGGIVIYPADCRDVIPKLGTVDHIITDPPYSSSSQSMHDRTRLLAVKTGKARDKNLLEFDSMDISTLSAVLASIDVQRWVVFTIDEVLGAQLRVSPPDGLRYVRTGIWVKPDSMPQFTGDRPAMGYEPIAIMHKAGARMRWNGGGKHAVWDYRVVRGKIHPTEKPLLLYKSFVELFTDPDDLILDPYMGSGVTLLAAKLLGRRAAGIEIKEEYCEWAASKLSHAMLDEPLSASSTFPDFLINPSFLNQSKYRDARTPI